MDADLPPPRRDDRLIPVVVITGPVGSGKSTVAATLGDLLAANGCRNACIDMDYLRWLQPAPAGDRFNTGLGYQNLAAIWPNLLAAGATCVVLADVVEDMRQRETCESLMPGGKVTIVRLDVPLNLIRTRLANRESGADLEWHRYRAVELQALMERAAIGDLVLDVGTRSPHAVAVEIAQQLNLFPSILAPG